MKKLIIVCAVLTASAALAQAPTANSASTPAAAQDSASAEKYPNERIC